MPCCRHIICDGAELARLWARIGVGAGEQLTWAPRENEARARPPGFRALAGGLSAQAITKLDPKQHDEFALISDEAPFIRAAVAAVQAAAPEAPLLVLSDKLTPADMPAHPCLRLTGLRAQLRDDFDAEFAHLGNLRRGVKLRALFRERKKLGILLQPDPDPDGIAAGLALRALLRRTPAAAPLLSFGEITRPENRALCAALGEEVRVIAAPALDEFDALALVDVQPNVFGAGAPARLRSADAVIDHHPRRGGADAVLQDIRENYGATATILVEYLLAADAEIPPKLATALLYGIKSDTQLLGRDAGAADMRAFAAVHALHSPALLRRIERPALPQQGLRALGRALSQSRVSADGVHLLALGRVREDVIPQVAELGLQAEGADWAVAAGAVGGNLVFSVRYNPRPGAGETALHAGNVVRAVVADFAGAGGGGHRSMAKGIVPLRELRRRHGRADSATVQRVLARAFARALQKGAK